ncbi:MAG: bacillithiol biosynthesis cysteine-adding enzyme BshC [Bryobacteraceae bacterium]|jgi:bacillithiol biosynthesis cysteine-adding enzyme BshC
MTESACIAHVELPGTTALFSDFQHCFQRLARFYEYSPWNPGSYDAAAREIRYPAERRERLVAALARHRQNPELLEKLARPGTVAVVTGQQVGLFGGPAYTVYKALTAVKLAETLSARGIEAVPVFWLATEDHDFAEVNQAWVFDAARTPIELKAANANGYRPVGTIPLENIPLAGLEQALAGFPLADEVLAQVREAYVEGRSWGEAFRLLIERVLGRHAVLFLDPLDEALREVRAPLLADAVRASEGLTGALLERNRELEQAGYHAQVHVEAETSLVFLLDGGRRTALRRHNGAFASKDRSYSTEELVAMAAQLSPNALLRPVMQDYLLPTVAYVGGPAELAYLAQSQVLYDRLLGRMPVALARATFTILDAHAKKTMDRFGLTVTCLSHGEGVVRDYIAARLIPRALHDEFAATRGSVQRALAELRREVGAFDSTLGDALDRSAAKMIYQLAKMEGKVQREALQRDERARAEAAYLSGLVFPNKHLQERLYGILPFLAQFGEGFVDTLYERVDLANPDHQLVVA